MKYNLRNIFGTFILLKKANRLEKERKKQIDSKLPINAYPPVYEADESLRLTLALAILINGVGLVIVALANYSKNLFVDVFVGLYGGGVILQAVFYLLATATRLRYQNPGEAQVWYISESARREIYDFMVEFFWDGLIFGLEITLPIYLATSIHPFFKGIAIAILELIVVNLYVRLRISVGVDRDRETGNLVFNYNAKMKGGYKQKEPFSAPPTTRNRVTPTIKPNSNNT